MLYRADYYSAGVYDGTAAAITGVGSSWRLSSHPLRGLAFRFPLSFVRLCVWYQIFWFVEESKNKGACFIAFRNYRVYCGLCYSRQDIVLLPSYTFLFSLFLLTMLQSKHLTKVLISHLNGLFNYLQCISARNT